MSLIVPDRGPRPWRTEPRTTGDRLVLAAWAELACVVMLVVWVAMFAWAVIPGADFIACFDPGPRCGASGPSAAYYVVFVFGWTVVLLASVASVLTARRFHRGRAQLWLSVATLAAPVVGLAGLHFSVGVFPAV